MATHFADKKNSQFTSFSVSVEGFQKLSDAIDKPKKPTEQLIALMNGRNS